MRRLVLVLAAIAAIGQMAVASLGCEDVKPDSQALQLLANTFVSARTQCQIRAGASEFRARGIMDVAVSNTYYMYPQVINQLEESEAYTGLTGEHLRLNNNNVTIRGATIYYDFSPTDPFLADIPEDFWSFYQPAFVHASGSVRPGEIAPSIVPVIPWELGNEIAKRMTQLGGVGTEIVIRITLEGALADGTPVQSSEFWYPITICNGCLVYFPPRVDCRQLEENIAVPCVPGQDDGVDCRLCYIYANGTGSDESLNEARDRCRWLHLFQGIEPPDSQKYWNEYQQFFPDADGPGGLNGVDNLPGEGSG